jgi:hypothetical protein
MLKHEIALMLAARYGYTSYLKICTAVTGGTFSLVDKKQFHAHGSCINARRISMTGNHSITTQAEH